MAWITTTKKAYRVCVETDDVNDWRKHADAFRKSGHYVTSCGFKIICMVWGVRTMARARAELRVVMDAVK